MSHLKKSNSHIGPASHEEIVKLIGHVVDEATITSILKTGATYADVEAAVMLLAGENEFSGQDVVTLTGTTGAVYDILAASHPFTPEESR